MAKKICPECEGEGSFGPGWVWTQDEVAEYDPEEFAELQRELRDGEHNVACEFCKGLRVVTSEREAEHAEWVEYQQEIIAEQRYFGGAA